MLVDRMVLLCLGLVALLGSAVLCVACGASPDAPAASSTAESTPSPTALPTSARSVTPSVTTVVTPHPSPPVEETQAPSPQPSGSAADAASCEDAGPVEAPAGVPLSSAYVPMPSHRDADLEEVIGSSLGDEVDSYGVVVKSLVTGAVAEVNPHKVFETASLFKLWVMYEVYKQVELGLVDMEEEVLVTPYYASFDAGTLPVEICDTLTVREALWAMITYSDNATGFLLRDKVGLWNIHRDLQGLGLTESALMQGDAFSTAADMVDFLEMMALGAAVSRDASREMLDLMLAQKVTNRLPALLPPGAEVANKTGDLVEVAHDVGIVYAPQPSYIIVVLSEQGGEYEPIALVSRAVYDYFNR